MEKKESVETIESNSQAVEKLEDVPTVHNEKAKQPEEVKSVKNQNIGSDDRPLDNAQNDISDKTNEMADERESNVMKTEAEDKSFNNVRQNSDDDYVDARKGSNFISQGGSVDIISGQNDMAKEMNESGRVESTIMDQKTDEMPSEDNNLEPVFDGTEVPGMETSRSTDNCSLDLSADPDTHGVVEKAVALKNFVRERSAVAVSTVLRRLSGKSDEGSMSNSDDESKNASESSNVDSAEKKSWNPLNYIRMSFDAESEGKNECREPITGGPQYPIAMKGRIILYTRLGCRESKKVRLFLYMKRLRYVEINIDVYPSRKKELDKISGSSSVPKVFFNEILIGGLNELKALDESGKLEEKLEFLITEAPSIEAPLPPLSGEDDESSSGALDEMALIVSKMKESIVVKDRFCKMRRFTKCFLGSEAVDFLSEDQYLERQEAVEFAQNLASKFFFHHVLDENLFEDGNHLYRFLDDDPIVASQCHNIPGGITTVKPKPIIEIASRLRFLSHAIFEAYVSEDGHHVNYRSLHGSEEFARYLRIIEELQRVEMWDMSREEKLAFFINLYNMMAIHAILEWGHPAGALERRKLFGDFKYVIGGSTYSLSAIQNGILRGNQRPPYNLLKPFGAKDKRARVALPYPEPLVHFALVCGTRSGPALRCYSPRAIDKELMDSARNFLRSGGLLIDLNTKVAYASKILKWFSVDFGKNDVEVLRHVSNYLDPADAAVLLDLLATSELKVIHIPYDWGLNY
ncbi:uncharacterized protein LOC114729125 [Neltuma alba]|uniref:uncharacterized protein LOC114729125 n=1 Tax=Neltuma alba TaxID=207710 RepID=UPI0010A4C183|nr:uncharacterized protein LOC114729125 [Prosopis alba]XP_028771919.1 uncharacterized protein LOC114729125 [Prosopis alba]